LGFESGGGGRVGSRGEERRHHAGRRLRRRLGLLRQRCAAGAVVGVFATGEVIVVGRALHVVRHHPISGKRRRPLTRRRLAGGLGRPTTRRWAVGHRVSPRGRQLRRHSAVGAVASAAVGTRLLLLPPFKRELTCDAAALDEAKEVVALPKLGRSQDLVGAQGGWWLHPRRLLTGLVAPCTAHYRTTEPKLSARARRMQRAWLGRRLKFRALPYMLQHATCTCTCTYMCMTCDMCMYVCAWNAACSSLVRRRASPRRSGSLYVTRCQCRIAASYASWTCDHRACI
jgi:hypothetical protein